MIPASKIAMEVLRTMQKQKYIGEFEFIDDGLGGKFRIQLLGRINKCGIITPRFNVKKDGYNQWERQYLPSVGVGILLVTTSKGVKAHGEAFTEGLGGRLLGYVY